MTQVLVAAGSNVEPRVNLRRANRERGDSKKALRLEEGTRQLWLLRREKDRGVEGPPLFLAQRVRSGVSWGPIRFARAAIVSAARGDMACEAIAVATTLALSWNPFRKSNSSAVKMKMISSGPTVRAPERPGMKMACLT